MKANLYNQIPDSLVRKIPRGQTVVYRLTDIKPDPFNEGEYLIPLNKNVPSTDQTYDPTTDNYIPIAYITGVEANGEAKFGNIFFQKVNGGCLILKSSNPQHQKMYQYLELCNWNKSNNNRSTDYPTWFEKIDDQEEAKSSRSERKIILNALRTADELDFNQVRSIAAMLGFKLNQSEDELRDLVEDYAGYEPEKFLSMVEQQTNSAEADIRQAVDLQILKHNKSSAKFVWVDTKEEVFTYKKRIGVKPFQEFAEHLLTENKEMYDAIKSRLQTERDNP
tara:strand:- start:226 stop:1062 length:837 start_codon:yes stop_codon:yes gene_type:complete